MDVTALRGAGARTDDPARRASARPTPTARSRSTSSTSRSRAGELVVPGRPVGLRQVHDAEDDQPADRADHRHGSSIDGAGRHRPSDPVKLRRGIGYVIQQIGLFPHQKIVTQRDDRAAAATASRRPRRASGPSELLDLVGLDPATYADRYPHQLSGGQRQRVGVARALAADPPVLLMDEPFGAVDPVVRVRLQDEFLRLQRELGKTVVLVTHDIDEAVQMGDRVAVFAAGRPARAVRHPGRAARPPGRRLRRRLRGRHPRPAPADGHPDRPRATSSRSTASPPATSARAIDLDATLEEALAVLLRDDKPMVGVKDGAQFVGVLTPDGIHRALRASLAESARTGS